MDTSMRLPAADTTALQSPRLPQRQSGLETARESGTPEAAPGVQVSISEQGRAAEQAARLETPAVPTETAQAVPVTASAAAAATTQTVSSVATPGPAADPARAQQPAQNPSAEARGVSTAEVQSDQRPDSASAATSQSVQLYLENASIPSGQSGSSAVRTSA